MNKFKDIDEYLSLFLIFVVLFKVCYKCIFTATMATNNDIVAVIIACCYFLYITLNKKKEN